MSFVWFIVYFWAGIVKSVGLRSLKGVINDNIVVGFGFNTLSSGLPVNKTVVSAGESNCASKIACSTARIRPRMAWALSEVRKSTPITDYIMHQSILK